MPFTNNARLAIENRYLIRDKSGNTIETIEEMFEKISEIIASFELTKEKQKKLKLEVQRLQMESKLRFNSPLYMNMRREGAVHPAGCFVSNLQDSIDSIFKTIYEAAIIHKGGGGYGYPVDRIRPAMEFVSTSAGRATGPFRLVMDMVETESSAIDEGGHRRAANMVCCAHNYPMIMEFIMCKDDVERFKSMNISVKVTDEFMDKVINSPDDFIALQFEGSEVNSHGEPFGQLQVKEIFQRIVRQAWKNGEPGVLFIDKMNDANPTPKLGKFESTNPCGEQPLLPYEACNLGSLNLEAYVVQDGGELIFDWAEFKHDIAIAVRAMDNIIEWAVTTDRYPVPEITAAVRRTRKIGLGPMGFAGTLFKLGIVYGSKESVEFAEEVAETMQETAKVASFELGKEKGNFEAFDGSIYPEQGFKYMRNAARTTVAPTGTISVTCDCTPSIEPLFALFFKHRVMGHKEGIPKFYEPFREALKKLDLDSSEVEAKIVEHGSCRNIQEIPEDIRKIYVTAHEISADAQLRIVAAFQKYVDSSISKTINLPKGATEEDVAEIIIKAYKLNLKGITVYVDGSRPNQPMDFGVGDIKDAGYKPRPTPDSAEGVKFTFNTGCGKLILQVFRDEEGMLEVFPNNFTGSGCHKNLEFTTVVLSRAIRAGVSVDALLHDFENVECPICSKARKEAPDKYRVNSAQHAMTIAVVKYRQWLKDRDEKGVYKPNMKICSRCKTEFYSAEKCPSCPKCGGPCGNCNTI